MRKAINHLKKCDPVLGAIIQRVGAFRMEFGEPTFHSLAEAILFTTSPRLMNGSDREAFSRVEEAALLSRYGGDCYAYCMLAAGHLDLIVETELKPHDIIPLMPIITGAGGIMTTWEGEPASGGGRIIAAGDRRVHEEAMRVLRAP